MANRNQTNGRKNIKGTKRDTRRNITTTEKEERNGDYSRKGSNDPSWYSHNPQLVKDAASIPFSWPAGSYLGTNYGTWNDDINYDPMFDTVPGVMTLEVMPMYGYVSDPHSALNVASNAIYSWVRHANSGSKVYDATDLMLYVTGMSQIYSYINYLMRVYGCALIYDAMNKYLPKTLVEAQGVDFVSVRDNLANFRYGINLLIKKAAQFAVPGTFDIFRRHAFLFQNVYTDGSTIKDQLYMYVPAGFYKFDLDEDMAGCLTKASPAKTAGTTSNRLSSVEDLLYFGNSLIDALITNNEDSGIMSGDILKAYGNNILTLNLLPEIWNISPVYSPEVLNQFQNATIMRGITIPDLLQDSEKTHLICRPFIDRDYVDLLEMGPTIGTMFSDFISENGMKWSIGSKVYTTPSLNPSPEEIMVGTRLTATFIPSDVTGQCFISAGSEIALAGYIYQTSVDASHYISYSRIEMASVCVFWDTTSSATTGEYADMIMGTPQLIKLLGALSKFNYHPEMIVFRGVLYKDVDEGDHIEFEAYTRVFNIANYGIITPSILTRMHEVALMSELDVQHIGMNVSK